MLTSLKCGLAQIIDHYIGEYRASLGLMQRGAAAGRQNAWLTTCDFNGSALAAAVSTGACGCEIALNLLPLRIRADICVNFLYSKRGN